VSAGGSVEIVGGVTVSNTNTGDVINVSASDSTITLTDGTIDNLGGGAAINLTNSGAAASTINIVTTDGTVTGDIVLGNEDDINFTGAGTNDQTGNISVADTTGTQTLDVTLDASGSTLTVGGAINNVDAFVLQEGIVTFGGAVDSSAGNASIDIQDGADLITSSTLDIGTGDIDLAGDATFTSGDTVTAGEIHLNGTGSVDISGDTINANLNIDNGTVNVDGTTVVVGDVEISTQTGATVDLSGTLTLGAGDQTLTFSGDGGGTFTGVEDDNYDGGAGTGDALVLSNSGGTIDLAGDISGFETITISGAGNQTLSGDVTGVTDINISAAGTITLDDSSGDLSIAGEIDTTDNAGAIVDIDQAATTATGEIDIRVGNSLDVTDATTITASRVRVGSPAGGATGFATDAGTTFNADLTISTDGVDYINDGAAGAGTVLLGNGDHDIDFQIGTSDVSLNDTFEGNAGGTNDIFLYDSTPGNTITFTGEIGDNIDTVELNTADMTYTGTAGLGGVNTDIEVGGGRTFIYNTTTAFDASVVNHGTAGARTVTFSSNADLTNAVAIDLTGANDDADTVTLDVGVVTGTIDTGAGADIIDVNGGTFNGTFSTGIGVDVITLADATFTSTFDAGDDETITVDGGTVSFDGTISNVADIDIDNGATLAFGNTTYDGTVSEQGAGEDQTVLIDGIATLTDATIAFGGGTDALNVTTSGAVALGAVTGAATTDFGINAVVTLNEDIAVGNITFNNATNAFATTLDAGGDVNTITTSGTITVNGANTIDLTIADTSIIKSGQSYTIVTDTGLGASLSGTFDVADANIGLFLNMTEDTTTVDVYAVEITSDADDVYSSATDIEGDAGNLTAITNAVLATPAGNTEIDAVHAALMAAATTADAEDIVEKLGPTIDSGFITGALTINTEANKAVGSRLASLRGGLVTGMAAGNAYYEPGLHMWGQTFGQYAEQDDRSGVKGYDSTTTGIAVGADTNNIDENLFAGVALSYAYTDVDSDNANQTETEINSYQITLYGEYALEQDYFVNGGLSYAHNDIDQTRQNVGVGNLTGQSDFDSQQYGFDFGLGRDIAVDNTSAPLTITPQLTANYVYVDVDDYTETGAGGLSLQNVNTEEFQVLDLGVSVDAVWDVAMDNGNTLLPALHVGYAYDVINDEVESTASFSGGGPAFRTEGFEPSAHTFNVGGGVTYVSQDNWELKGEYDFEAKDDFQAHTALIKAQYNF